jgi:hypothetical protein
LHLPRPAGRGGRALTRIHRCRRAISPSLSDSRPVNSTLARMARAALATMVSAGLLGVHAVVPVHSNHRIRISAVVRASTPACARLSLRSPGLRQGAPTCSSAEALGFGAGARRRPRGGGGGGGGAGEIASAIPQPQEARPQQHKRSCLRQVQTEEGKREARRLSSRLPRSSSPHHRSKRKGRRQQIQYRR